MHQCELLLTTGQLALQSQQVFSFRLQRQQRLNMFGFEWQDWDEESGPPKGGRDGWQAGNWGPQDESVQTGSDVTRAFDGAIDRPPSGRHDGRESKEIRLDLAERSWEGHASVQFPQQSMGQAVGRG
jgi:hypothetical protein